MEVGDAFVGIDHRECRALCVGRLDVGLDRGLLIGGELGDFCNQVAETIVEVDAEGIERGGVFGDEVLEEHLHGVAEDDRVGNFHHRRLHVQREQHAIGFGGGDLCVEETGERLLADESRVDDFTGLERSGFLERACASVLGDELDFHIGRIADRDGFFVRKEIAFAAHRADAGLRACRPCAHRVRVFARVVLHCFWCAAVGVAFAQDRIHGRAEHLGVTRAGLLFRIGRWVFWEIGNRVALCLKLGDGGFELRNRCGNIGQLDDVGIGQQREGAEFGEVVRVLAGFGKLGEDAAGERDVARFHLDAGAAGEALHDRQQRVGRKCGGFVGLGVDDG